MIVAIPGKIQKQTLVSDQQVQEMYTVLVQVTNKSLYLHPDDSVDKEEHHDEQSDMRKSLQTQTAAVQFTVFNGENNEEDHSGTDLEGLDEGPQQVTNAL